MKPYHIIVLASAALLLGYLFCSNPNASFRSTDGKWADSEIEFKGRTFDHGILMLFELYKSQCSAPKADIVRTTRRQWANIFAWPSYWTNPKWRVPYADPIQILGDYHEPDCMNEASMEALDRAEMNANKFLMTLETSDRSKTNQD